MSSNAGVCLSFAGIKIQISISLFSNRKSFWDIACKIGEQFAGGFFLCIDTEVLMQKAWAGYAAELTFFRSLVFHRYRDTSSTFFWVKITH